jgi:hypothetical protein
VIPERGTATRSDEQARFLTSVPRLGKNLASVPHQNNENTWNVEVRRAVGLPLPGGYGSESRLRESEKRTASDSEKRTQRHKWLENACQAGKINGRVIIQMFHRAPDSHRFDLRRIRFEV